jgi:hypothetical protein
MTASGPEPRGASAQTGGGDERTRWISPGKPNRSRLASTEAPRAPGLSEAPTMATERGIGGRACVARVADLPAGIDAAVLAIPGPAVLDAVQAEPLQVGQHRGAEGAGLVGGADDGDGARREEPRQGRTALVPGRACVARVADLPAGIDAAVLAIPGPAVLDAVRALAASG